MFSYSSEFGCDVLADVIRILKLDVATDCSSLRPTVETKYPTDHSPLWGYISLMNLNFFLRTWELCPFSFCTTSATEYFGGISMRIWTWSSPVLILWKYQSGQVLCTLYRLLINSERT